VVSTNPKKGKITAKGLRHDPLWDLVGTLNDKIGPHKQTLIYGVLGVVGAIVLGSIVYMVMNMQSSRGQAALASALEIYNAPVVTAGSEEAKNSAGKKTYPDKQQKFKEAATAFDGVANNHSSYEKIARYYAAMSRTHFDPAQAQTQLEALKGESSEVGFWSKIGLAELFSATGQIDKAIAAYQELKENPGPLPKSLIFYNLGLLYERQGKNAEAIDAYFKSASDNRKSAEGRKSNERLNVLDPATAKKLPVVKEEEEGDS
jgi:tetratricopeptide (TPR) repeat protein